MARNEVKKDKQMLREQYGEDINIISYSQLKLFSKCPFQWQLEKVEDGMKVPSDSVHTIGGTAFHDTVQLYLEYLYDDQKRAMLDHIDLKQAFEKRMMSVFSETIEQDIWQQSDDMPSNPKELAEYCESIFPILKEFEDNIEDHFNPSITSLRSIEELVHTKVGNDTVFMGYIDVVLKDEINDKYILIDLKTSTKGWGYWKKKDAKLTGQLLLYKKYFAETLGIDTDDVGICYWVVSRNPDKSKSPIIEDWTPTKQDDHLQEMELELDKFLNEAFPSGQLFKTFDEDAQLSKNPQKYECVWCPYSQQFSEHEDMAVCDQNGERFDDYSEGMRPYIDDKWIED